MMRTVSKPKREKNNNKRERTTKKKGDENNIKHTCRQETKSTNTHSKANVIIIEQRLPKYMSDPPLSLSQCAAYTQRYTHTHRQTHTYIQSYPDREREREWRTMEERSRHRGKEAKQKRERHIPPSDFAGAQRQRPQQSTGNTERERERHASMHAHVPGADEGNHEIEGVCVRTSKRENPKGGKERTKGSEKKAKVWGKGRRNGNKVGLL